MRKRSDSRSRGVASILLYLIRMNTNELKVGDKVLCTQNPFNKFEATIVSFGTLNGYEIARVTVAGWDFNVFPVNTLKAVR